MARLHENTLVVELVLPSVVVVELSNLGRVMLLGGRSIMAAVALAKVGPAEWVLISGGAT